jgi:pyruvoyl-dependent arginine decarboxylase (PvlArgDC)
MKLLRTAVLIVRLQDKQVLGVLQEIEQIANNKKSFSIAEKLFHFY